MKNLTCIEYEKDSDRRRKTKVYLGPILTHPEVCQMIAQAPLQRKVAEGQVFIGDEYYLVTDIFVREGEVTFKQDTYRKNFPRKVVDLSSRGNGLNISRELLTDRVFRDSFKDEIVVKQL